MGVEKTTGLKYRRVGWPDDGLNVGLQGKGNSWGTPRFLFSPTGNTKGVQVVWGS